MSNLVKFEFKQMPAMRIIGKAVYPKLDMVENPVPAFWSMCFQEGMFMTLEGLTEHIVDPAYVGLMCDYSAGNGVFTYIVGMLMAADTPVPEGFAYKDVNASTAAVGWIQGPEKENYGVAHELTQKEIEKHGYQCEDSAGWCMELYNCPRFTTPMENGDVILDYYIPCVPKE